MEKRVNSPLLEPNSIHKIVKLDERKSAHYFGPAHYFTDIGCAMSGLVADARTLVDHARVETQNHWFTYDEKMGVDSTVQSVCDLAMGFGEGNMVFMIISALLTPPSGSSVWCSSVGGWC